jgi:site-specific recombinase XerD
MSAVTVHQATVDARGRLRRTVAPPPAAWAPDHAALYRAFLRWLDPQGVPPARERTTLVAVRHLLASFPGPVEPATLATAVTTFLSDYACRGAAPGTLQQYGSALRLFRRFVAIQCGLPPAVAPSPTPERYLAPLPPWMRPRLLEYILVQSRGWRPEARRTRTHALAAHFARVLRFLHRVAPMAAWGDLTRASVETWIDHRLATGRKPRTVASDVMLLRSFYAFLLESEEVMRSPLQRPLGIRLPDMLPRFIPDDAVAQLTVQREAAVARVRTMHATRQARLNLAVFYLLVDSGLRCGELVGICCEDVDLAARRLCVRHAKLQRDRLVYLSPRTIQALRAYLTIREAARTDHLFVQRGSAVTTRCIAGRLERWGAAVGIRLSPHRLRHTYATRLLNAGMPIASLQKTLGHRSLAKTVLYARIADPIVEGDYYRALTALDAKGARIGEGLMAESVRRQLLHLVDQLLSSPMPPEERETLLRHMRRLLEPPAPGDHKEVPTEPKKE